MMCFITSKKYIYYIITTLMLCPLIGRSLTLNPLVILVKVIVKSLEFLANQSSSSYIFKYSPSE